jgi:hypothetical protein
MTLVHRRNRPPPRDILLEGDDELLFGENDDLDGIIESATDLPPFYVLFAI